MRDEIDKIVDWQLTMPRGVCVQPMFMVLPVVSTDEGDSDGWSILSAAARWRPGVGWDMPRSTARIYPKDLIPEERSERCSTAGG